MIILEDNNFIPVECPHCQSKIGVHLNDIIYHEMHSAPYTAKCGACHGTVKIREQTIPTAWIAKIEMNNPTTLDPNAKYRFVMWFHDAETENNTIKFFRILNLTEQRLNEILWWADYGDAPAFMAAESEIEWAHGKHDFNADQVAEINGYCTEEVDLSDADVVMQKWHTFYTSLGLTLGPIETMTESEYESYSV